LIRSVSSSKTVALRASSLAVVSGQKGLRSTVGCQIPPCWWPDDRSASAAPCSDHDWLSTACHKKTPAEAGVLKRSKDRNPGMEFESLDQPIAGAVSATGVAVAAARSSGKL
jgi:hypothetical protein